MKTIFELKRIELQKSRYPVRKTNDHRLGLYSSLKQAEKAMMKVVAEEKEWAEQAKIDGDYDFSYDDTFGFSIMEIKPDIRDFYFIAMRTYTKYGTFNDESIYCDAKDTTNYKPFYGRPEEKIRFEMGDIVEVWQYNMAELCIVCSPPPSTQEYEEKKKKCEQLNMDVPQWDVSDDSYLIYSLGIADTHSHPSAPQVFAPLKKVTVNLKRKLRAKLIAMMIINAHKCTEEFMWQNVKDPKVVNEVLNDFERIPNRYLSTVCHFTNYLTFTEVQIMLNISEKQAKRFGRFYEKCKWQAKKEEGKRGKHTDNYGL